MLAGGGALGAGHLLNAWASRQPSRNEHYAYRDEAFTGFVTDSYQVQGSGEPEDFYNWLEAHYLESPTRRDGDANATLVEVLDQQREALQEISDSAARATAEMEFGGWMHKMVKAVIPRFSLDRGFEFFNTVRYGERQCFLQSVLIAGMLQRAGMDAGVAMVSRNIEGVETNNGHAVVVLKRSDGTDVLVDASDPTPHVRQQGLYLKIGSDYRYLTPAYTGASGIIAGYTIVGAGDKIAAPKVRTLDIAFLRSQFSYYRGERAPGGIVATKLTPAGLEASTRYLKESIELCPENPLSLYQLGRVYMKQGRQAEARKQIGLACAAYNRAGWLPSGPRNMRQTLMSSAGR